MELYFRAITSLTALYCLTLLALKSMLQYSMLLLNNIVKVSSKDRHHNCRDPS